MAITEADTCRKYVVKRLYDGGWTDDQISEQKTFTDGRIVVAGDKATRRRQKRADYLLRYRPDFMIAVVEAKAAYKHYADGLQQAKEYAQVLGLKFAYSTNGHGIIEHDFVTGKDTVLEIFPSPQQLWERLKLGEGISEGVEQRLLSPFYHLIDKPPRYYQEIAVNGAVKAILEGKRRVLLTLATGTGKTLVAFQICWKLWSTRWNTRGEYRRPRILYLADRNILVDDPKDKLFPPFGDARWKIQGEAIKSREMYFATYQAIARDERRPGLFREYPPDFFDLVIVEECHRGSARDESNWREILEYFEPAYQLGMTATPLREDNRDTYRYFGNPVYTYSLRQGIEDGFLAPYRVHRVVTTVDAAGWRPTKGQVDRYLREIPDAEYTTKDFERMIALKARTEAIARHLTDFLKGTDRFGKTIVFCVDQEHAEATREALNNLNLDVTREHPDYVCRVVSDEGDIGRGHLSRFQELETAVPVIVTTSQLLTTGVDVPMCKNVAIARVINSMTEFKQVIGRGTRVRDDYGKLYFNILDYTGSATRLFADPEFDGEPALITEQEINEHGQTIEGTEEVVQGEESLEEEQVEAVQLASISDDSEGERRKYYVDEGSVEIAAHLVYELDADGKQIRVVKFTDYTAEKVRSMCPSAAALRSKWSNAEERAAIIESLEERGISFDALATATGQPDADPFDLLCHVAFNAPLRSRRERAERLRKEQRSFFERYSPEAKQILDDILDKYIEYGTAQFKLPDILKLPPISSFGNVLEIARKFGGPKQLRRAVTELQAALYAA
ncbi:MAG: type I restriction-modification enzyme R subunit C-terminal domain-containing protein [Bacillota bacterium]|nr:type I restriction-modification enzyme R subunit C-terminal domain-containing protein [Bacillota bacterium]